MFDLLGADRSRLLPSWKKRLINALDGTVLTVFMTILTLLVLFLDDIRVAAMPPEADHPIIIFTYIAFVCFAIELSKAVHDGKSEGMCLGLNSLSKPKFFLGFYFWLDLVSTLSLLGDIPEFMELVTGEPQDGSGGVNESTTLARAGRTSRAGTRAGRIARVRRQKSHFIVVKMA